MRVGEVKCPVLLIMGSKDRDFPSPAEEARVQGHRLNAQVMMVEGAGHYPHAELPDLVGPAILNFLQACAW